MVGSRSSDLFARISLDRRWWCDGAGVPALLVSPQHWCCGNSPVIAALVSPEFWVWVGVGLARGGAWGVGGAEERRGSGERAERASTTD